MDLYQSNSNLTTAGINPSNITPTNSSGPSQPSIDNLYPAIVQCFVIILAGYVAGRAHIITPTQGKGIGTFVGKFCLPALLFRSMVELDFSSVNWYFLLGIAISKTTVFVSVAALTLFVKRPLSYGDAGLFGMFTTQSNDFALGYPILQALYSESHPEYLQYIYLISPISLIFLNPIGFTLLELNRLSEDKDSRRSKLTVFVHVVKDLLSNPIVFMSFIGLLGNFLFKQKVPSVIDDILLVLGNAFSASALFYLGVSLVGKVQGHFGKHLIVPLLLIAAKTLLLPLITWQVVDALVGDYTSDSKSLSMYAFLYGTFPTAPTVFLYASQYSYGQDMIASALVICTFLSAPIMFVSAKMLTLIVDSEMDYKSLLLDTSFDFSVISLVCNIWVLGLLFFSRRYKKMPHHFLVCLVVAQTLMCIGMVSYDGRDTHIVWKHYLQFVTLLVGVFSTRCFVAVISLVLYFIHCRSLCFVLRIKIWLYFFGIGFPLLCVGLLLVFGTHHLSDEIDPSFHYGKDQAIMSLIILGMCTIINITSLVLRQRNSRLTHKQDMKVKRNFRKHVINSGAAGDGGDSSEDEEGLRERLLPAAVHVEEEPPRRKRTISQKSLSKSEDGRARRKYRSTSCSNCLENCDAAEFNAPSAPRAATSNIEDIIPFPTDMQRGPARPNVKKPNRGNRHDGGHVNRESCQGEGGSQCSGQCGGGGSGGDKHGTTRTSSCISSSSSDDSAFTDTVRVGTCESGTCDYQQKRQCVGLLRCYNATNNLQVRSPEDGNIQFKQPRRKLEDEYQTDKFVALILVLQLSVFIGVFLCTWRLFNKGTSGIYVEIEFLDSFFNYAQSLVVFAIFGFDTRLVVLPCIRRWRQCIYGVEIPHIPEKSQLAPEDKLICDQFMKYHLDNCLTDIVRDRKYKLRSYSDVFCGTSFCDWLVDVGLCRDRSEAITYGRTLVRGQVIHHVTNEHDFYDMPYFYKFVDQEEEWEEVEAGSDGE